MHYGQAQIPQAHQIMPFGDGMTVTEAEPSHVTGCVFQPHVKVRSYIYAVFFFQAEDGIRDYKVTGVQTCALPISWAAWWTRGRRPTCTCCRARTRCWSGTAARGCGPTSTGWPGPAATSTHSAPTRSGERRVGEEGRTRGAPDH